MGVDRKVVLLRKLRAAPEQGWGAALWREWCHRPMQCIARRPPPQLRLEECDLLVGGKRLVAQHLLHLGFCDQGSEQYSPILVPFVYGYAACLVGAKLEDNGSKSLSAYRATCQNQLGPAFRP